MKKILLYGLIIAIIFLKFFADGEHIPSLVPPIVAATADVFFLFAFAVYTFFYIATKHRGFYGAGIGIYLLLFVFVSLVSICLNINGIQWKTSSLFLLLHLEPILIALMIVNLNYDEVFIRKIMSFLFILCVIEIFIGLVQIPFAKFKAGWNTEYICGTLGRGNAQYVPFMAMTSFLMLGMYLYNPRRKYLLLLVMLAMLLYYGPDYAVTTLSLPFTIFLLLILCVPWQTPRKILYSVALLFSFILAYLVYSNLAIGASIYRSPRYFSSYLEQPSIILQIGKIKAITVLPSLYGEKIHYALVGVGPGSYSSRAFMFIGDYGFRTRGTMSGGMLGTAVELQYAPPMASKYIIGPYTNPTRACLFGSSKLDSPFQSYTSIAAETGILGFIFFFMIYYKVFKLALEINRKALSENDEFYWVVSFTSIGNILFLFQLAFFDNWFEIPRVTILTWILLAILLRKKTLSNELHFSRFTRKPKRCLREKFNKESLCHAGSSAKVLK